MKDKFLKIGALITLISIMYVQLDLKGSEGTNFTICDPPIMTEKIGKYKKITTTISCGTCTVSGSGEPVYDAGGNQIGYLYPASISTTNGSNVECQPSTVGGSCATINTPTETGICTSLFSPTPIGTGTGTGTGL